MIKKLVTFIGEFQKRNHSLPPGCENLLKPISGSPRKLMKFLTRIEKEYPAALKELIRIEFDSDDGGTASDDSGQHYPKERAMKASLSIHKRAEQERMFV